LIALSKRQVHSRLGALLLAEPPKLIAAKDGDKAHPMPQQTQVMSYVVSHAATRHGHLARDGVALDKRGTHGSRHIYIDAADDCDYIAHILFIQYINAKVLIFSESIAKFGQKTFRTLLTILKRAQPAGVVAPDDQS
jgi:hypothetical protein